MLIGRNPFFANTGPIVKLSNATGGALAVSDYTTGGSLTSSPGIALADDGTLYVSDQTYNFGTGIASGPVKRYDADGTYTGEVIADGASGLAGPTGMAIKGNTLYTSSIMSGNVLQTDLTSDATTAFFSTGSPFEAGPLAISSNGELLVGSPSGSGNIYHVGADGTLIGTFASGLGQLGGIAVFDDGVEPGPPANLFFSEFVSSTPNTMGIELFNRSDSTVALTSGGVPAYLLLVLNLPDATKSWADGRAT